MNYPIEKNIILILEFSTQYSKGDNFWHFYKALILDINGI